MSKIKVGIIGCGDSKIEVIRALKSIKRDIEIIDILDDEVKNSVDIELTQFEPLNDYQIPDAFKFKKPKLNNEWRGGSLGKGGKTKWPRR